MAPKKNITEETFHTFQREVEQNSIYLVDQLLQKINKLEEKCNNMDEKYKDIEQELNAIKIKNDRISRQQLHDKKRKWDTTLKSHAPHFLEVTVIYIQRTSYIDSRGTSLLSNRILVKKLLLSVIV